MIIRLKYVQFIYFCKTKLSLNKFQKINQEFKYNYPTYWPKILIVLFIIINRIIMLNLYNKVSNILLSFDEKMKFYSTKKFAIIRKLECPQCGFFSFYIIHLGCINKYLSEGYIPIIDLQSFSNVYNKNKTLKQNPWELFFYQPYNYTLEEVLRFAKNITYFICISQLFRPSELNIYYQKYSINFWHNFAKKYMPVRNEIIQEVKIIMQKLFFNSRNILGVKLRGTDFLSLKPKAHSIQPKVEQVILDVKEMDRKFKYDFIFFATEDELIKQKFLPEFGEKLKLYNPNVIIQYNYNDTYLINLNEKINGNLEYIKNYLINIIILSNCLDLITSKGCGPAGIFILTKGFRNTKVYDLGCY